VAGVKPGEKVDDPELLEPTRIQEAIENDRAVFVKYAHGLHDAAIEALGAVHLQFWYPRERAIGNATDE